MFKMWSAEPTARDQKKEIMYEENTKTLTSQCRIVTNGRTDRQTTAKTLIYA